MEMTIEEFEEYAKAHNIIPMTRELYENRLKADLKAILVELQMEIEECVDGAEGSPQFEQGVTTARVQVVEIIQEKINELKQESTTKTDKVDCKHTDCNNCVNHKYCDYEPTTKNDLPHCQCTDAEIAKSFIEDVEAVKDQLPTTKNNLGVDREDAVERLNALKQLIGYDKDSEIVKATQKSLDMAIKALDQEPRKGHWINKHHLFDSCSAECSSCHERSNGYMHDNGFSLECKYYDFCPNCGAKMIESQESEEKA